MPSAYGATLNNKTSCTQLTPSKSTYIISSGIMEGLTSMRIIYFTYASISIQYEYNRDRVINFLWYFETVLT